MGPCEGPAASVLNARNLLVSDPCLLGERQAFPSSPGLLVLEESETPLLLSPLEIQDNSGLHLHVCWLLRAS